MGPLYLILSTICDSFQNAVKKFYKGKAPIFLTSIAMLFCAVFFLFVCGFNINIGAEEIWHTILICIAFSFCGTCITLALIRGSLSFSLLIISLSLLIPTFYGILFLGNEPSVFFYVGLAFLVVMIVLLNVNFSKKTDKTPKKFDWVWVLLLTVAFILNGISSSAVADCTKYHGASSLNDILCVGAFCAFIINLSLSFILERKNIKASLKQVAVISPTSGLLTGAVNIFVILTQLEGIPAAILFPVVSGGSTILSLVLSLFVFKEKLTRQQLIGFAFGVISLVFLNL